MTRKQHEQIYWRAPDCCNFSWAVLLTEWDIFWFLDLGRGVDDEDHPNVKSSLQTSRGTEDECVYQTPGTIEKLVPLRDGLGQNCPTCLDQPPIWKPTKSYLLPPSYSLILMWYTAQFDNSPQIPNQIKDPLPTLQEYPVSIYIHLLVGKQSPYNPVENRVSVWDTPRRVKRFLMYGPDANETTAMNRSASHHTKARSRNPQAPTTGSIGYPSIKIWFRRKQEASQKRLVTILECKSWPGGIAALIHPKRWVIPPDRRTSPILDEFKKNRTAEDHAQGQAQHYQ